MAGRKSRRALALAGALLLVTSLAALRATPVLASTVTSAVFSGGAGTVTSGGTLYARNGAALTLRVTTSSDTKCVEVSGDFSASQSSAAGQSSWTFTFVAGVGDGTKTATIKAKPNTNCTGTNGNGSASLVLDNTGPAVGATVTPAPNAAGWNNSGVSIAWTASDAGAGVATGPTPATAAQATDTTGTTFTASATDRLGNIGSGSVTVKVDTTLPSITAAVTPAPNAAGWNNHNVTVSFACSDGTSGISSCPGSTRLDANGAGQTVTGSATDVAGNTAGASVTVNIDKAPPSLSGAPASAPNAAGWYSGDVGIHWTCSDALSGIAGGCPADSTITGEGSGLVATASVSDLAGNVTTASSTPGVNIDRTAPVTVASAPGGWNNTSVAVSLTPSDNLSGVAATYYSVDGRPATAGTSVTVSGEGIHTVAYWSVDRAGNTEAPKSATVQIDLTPPTISDVHSPGPNAAGWNNAPVTVTFACADALSGVASCTVPQTVATDGAAQAVTGTAVDMAGNTATDHALVNIDRAPPVITGGAAPAANAAGWNNTDVTVTFACSDSVSGIATCASAQTLTTEGGAQSVAGTAVDAAGNSASATVGGINIDKTPPSISGAATAAPNAAGWYSGDVTVAWTCSDALSGLASPCPANSTITGEGANRSASVSVSDNAGNVGTGSVTGINIDRTAPVTVSNVSPPLASGWYAGAVSVPLSATDGLSGVATTFYAIDGGAAQTYIGALVYSTGGTHSLTFWSVDAAGNVEDRTQPANTITIRIDNVRPTITGTRNPRANAAGWNNGPVTVSFECSDAESGIASCDPSTAVLSTAGSGQSVTGTATDNAGNTARATVGDINIDLEPPVIAGALSPLPNDDGWNRGDVTVHWSCTDALSGVDAGACPADTIVGGEGADLAADGGAASDRAGNVSAPAHLGGIRIDRTPPSISGAPTTAPVAGGWYGGDVTIHWTCSDALSGIDAAGCPADSTITGQGANLSATASVADVAGNSASATVSGINIDRTPPVTAVSATAQGGDNIPFDGGNTTAWINQGVNLTFAPSDAESGPAATHFSIDGAAAVEGTTVAIDGEGDHAVSFWSTDVVGNAETPRQVHVRIDLTKPLIEAALDPAVSGWTNAAAVTVTFTCSDALSGVATCSDRQTVTAEGATTVTGIAVDVAGNSADLPVSIEIDRTPPVTTATLPAGWRNAPVTVSLSASDTESGVAATHYQVDGGTIGAGTAFTVSGEGVHAISYWSEDSAGNAETPNTASVRIDLTAPVVTASLSPGADAYGWYRGPVTVTFSCSDALSGVADCPAPVVISTEGRGQSVTGTAHDTAGNAGSVTVSGINIDLTAPALTLSGVADYTSSALAPNEPGVYLLGNAPASVGCSATDALSGLASPCSVTVTGGLPNGVGLFTVTATATDRAGNTATVVDTYHVIYRFDGFLQPVNDTAHQVGVQMSQFKAGSTVPVKFQLKKADGTVVVPNSPPMWDAPAGVAQTAAAAKLGSSSPTGFRWDAVSQLWIANYRSPGQAGYVMVGVTLDDGLTDTVVIALR